MALLTGRASAATPFDEDTCVLVRDPNIGAVEWEAKVREYEDRKKRGLACQPQVKPPAPELTNCEDLGRTVTFANGVTLSGKYNCDLPQCAAHITIPGGLKPGDTLTPSATVSSIDGKTAQGQVHLSWLINGKSASSVIWDGQETRIELQLSCQKHAQVFQLLLPTYVPSATTTDSPPSGSSETTQTPVSPDPSATTPAPIFPDWALLPLPGLGRIGLIPGPKTALEAIIGVLAPGLIGILGGLLGGLFGNPPPTSATPAVASGGNDVLEDPRAEINRINQQWREASRGVDPNGPGYADFKKGYDDYRQSLQDKIAVDAAARATAPAEPPPKDIEYTYPDGRSTVLVYDPKHGGYINTLTGGLVAHGDIDKWKQNNAQTAQQTDAWRTANKQITAAGLDAQSQALAAIKNRNDQQAKTLANLGKMEKEIIFGNGSVRDLYKAPGEPGNILTNIQNLRQQILDGNGTDLKKYQSIRRLYGDTSSGKAAMPDSIPSQNAQVRDIINTSIKYTVNEVATGQDASGGTSLKGLAVRGLLGWITGGASEVVLVPVQSVTTMKDYVDKGGNSIVGGFVRAVSEVAVSEISNVAVGGLVKGAVSGGKWAGAGFTKVTGSLKEAVNNAAKNGSSAAKTLVSAAENASTKTNAAYDKAVKFWSGEKAPPYKPPADLPKANPTYGTSSVAGARPGAGPTGPLVSTGTGPNIGYVRQPQTPVAPHMTGMPEASIRHAQVVGDKFGVKVDVRPTTPKAAQLLISGEAKPKPGWIKNKTVNELDEYLGAKADNLGKAGHFDPKLPPKGKMPDAQYKDLTDRFNQRQAEYVHNNSSIRNDPRLLVKDGLIIEKASGKPFTGDHDIFDIRGVDGKPVPQAVRDQVIKELSQPPFNAQHGAHMEGGWVKNATLAGIDSTIINGHTLGEPGSKPLITFGPDRPPESTFVVGSR